MSFHTKRPRQLNNSHYNPIEVVDLTAEDEPPRKRQRSIPPLHQGVYRENAKPKFSSTDNPAAVNYLKRADPRQFPATKVTLPRNSSPLSLPQLPATASQKAPKYRQDAAVLVGAQNGNSRPKSKEIPNHNAERLRDLSLDLVKSEPPSQEPAAARDRPGGVIAAGHGSRREVKVTQVGEGSRSPVGESFKLRDVRALKFNPESRQSDMRWHNTEQKLKSNSGVNPHSRLDRSSLNSKESLKQHVEIHIPLRSTPGASQPRKVTTPNLTSTQQSNGFSINVPLSDAAKSKQTRKALQQRLKQGPKYLQQNPVEARKILGLTGFSLAEFPLDLDRERFEKAGQPKKRSVDRSRTMLNTTPPTKELTALKLDSPPNFVHPRDRVKAILTDRFFERFNPPLTFSNSVNDRRLHGKFQFISGYILRKNVKATGSVGHPSCMCAAPCNNSCMCLRKTFKEDRSKTERVEYVPQYERRPDGLVVLRDDFIRRYTIQWDMAIDEDVPMQRLPERVEIAECTEHCPCDDSCVNRVVQKGRTVPLDIFETNRCGFGVRSPKNLVRGQFIELYLGEVITETELVRREEAAEAGSTSYIYSLDWFSSQQSYHIDGENFGSAMRFVNHSCDPNAGTFTVLNNQSTKQLHYVAFFAIKDILAGTEITIDYTPQAAGQTYELKAADEGMERCYCRSANCRQMLWMPGKERKARKKTVGKTFD